MTVLFWATVLVAAPAAVVFLAIIAARGLKHDFPITCLTCQGGLLEDDTAGPGNRYQCEHCGKVFYLKPGRD